MIDQVYVMEADKNVSDVGKKHKDLSEKLEYERVRKTRRNE